MIRLFPSFQPSISDAKGRRVVVLDPIKRCDWPLSGDERIALLRRRLGATRSRLSLRDITLYALWFGGSLAGYFLVRAFVFKLFPASGLYQSLLTFGAMCVVLYTLGWLLSPHWIGGSPEVARQVVGEGLCACCGYNLHELTSVPGPIVTCSECGAGWERTWIVRSAPFAPGSTLGSDRGANPLRRESWTVRDAEGTSVPCITPPLRVPRGVARDDPRLAAWRQAGREIARNDRPKRIIGFCLLWPIPLGYCGFVVYVLWRDWSRGLGVSNSVIVMLVISAIASLAAIGWSLFGNFCYSKHTVCADMLRAKLCPSCVLDLSHIAPDAGGVCRCTRCRSLWDLPKTSRGVTTPDETQPVRAVGGAHQTPASATSPRS